MVFVTEFFHSTQFLRDLPKLCVEIIHSFLLLGSILWYGCTIFNHLPIESHLAHFQFLAVRKTASMNIHVPIFKNMFLTFSEINAQVQMLDYMVVAWYCGLDCVSLIPSISECEVTVP